MPLYRAHGVNIRSELLLPELTVTRGDLDVTIRFGTVRAVPTGVTRAGTRFSVDTKSIYLFYDAAAVFEVRRGREIVIQPYPGVDEEVLRLLLHGPVMAGLLHQRGMLVLHASAVALDGAAVLFLGVSGAGKSSIAAALEARGHTFLSDDVVAVELGRVPTVHGGFGQLKLWPDSAEAVAMDSRAGVQLRAGLAKRGWPHPAPAEGPLPVGRVLILEPGPASAMTKMSHVEAFTALVRHSYVAPLYVDTGLDPRHFRQCTVLAARGLVWRFGYKRALAELANVAAYAETSLEKVRAVCIPSGT